MNELLAAYSIESVIEFGCGDGNQLRDMKYQKYLGLDVSAKAVQLCMAQYKEDPSKSFMMYDGRAFSDKAGFIRADAALSLDVLYHLVENDVYETYLQQLFSAADRYVIIYSTNEELPQFGGHELHRIFTADVKRLIPGWEMDKHIKNKYPVSQFGEEHGSRADFFIYKKK